SWNPAGAVTLGSRSINSLAVDPHHPELVYAGLSSAGAFRSTDGGATWTAALNGFPFPQISVNALSVDPTNSVVYAATSFRVFKSTDGAATWTDASVGFGPNASFLYSFVIDPNSHTTLYAGSAADGVYTSLDAGATWTSLSSGLSGYSRAVFSLAVNPSNSGILYAGTVGRSVHQYTMDLTLPFIASATFDGKKVITIQGRSFGQNSTVLINGVDKTEFVKTSGDAKITMKGKAKKFGL